MTGALLITYMKVIDITEETMAHQFSLTVAGIIFSIVAIMHLLRVLYHWDVTIAKMKIPMSVSIAGFIASGALAIWMFAAAS
jgi:hypothetical protein